MLSFRFSDFHFLTALFFMYFREKDLGIFSVAILSNKWQPKSRKKSAETFYCDTCDYTCYRIHEFNKHNTTRQHYLATYSNNIVAEKSQKVAVSFYCETCHFTCSRMKMISQNTCPLGSTT